MHCLLDCLHFSHGRQVLQVHFGGVRWSRLELARQLLGCRPGHPAYADLVAHVADIEEFARLYWMEVVKTCLKHSTSHVCVRVSCHPCIVPGGWSVRFAVGGLLVAAALLAPVRNLECLDLAACLYPGATCDGFLNMLY